MGLDQIEADGPGAAGESVPAACNSLPLDGVHLSPRPPGRARGRQVQWVSVVVVVLGWGWTTAG